MKNYALDKIICQVRQRELAGSQNENYDFDLCYHKIIWYSDSIFRVKNYEFPIVYNFKGSGGRQSTKYKNIFGGDEVFSEIIRKKTEYKIRKTVYELANCNFNQNSRFVSLVPAENITEAQEANKYFRDFIQRMKYKFGDFDYLAVIEFQKLHREAVHYHVLWNLDYVKQEKILKIWGDGKGSVYINKIYHVDNLGAYLLRCMGKSVGDPRLFGNKAYLCSKGLKRAKVQNLNNDAFKEFVKKYDLENRKPAYKIKGYQTENYGWVDEMEYNLKR
jgi:hypothetical protein